MVEGEAISLEAGAEVSSSIEVGVATPRDKESVVEPPPSEYFPVGGRLAHFRQQWAFDPWAFSIVSKGLGWSWVTNLPSPNRFFQEPTPFLAEYVQELLSKSVIKKAKSLRFQGRLFCVPKRDSDKKRVICLLYTSPSPRDGLLSRMPSSA